MKYFIIGLTSVFLLSGCQTIVTDSGCMIYSHNRISMPRPLPDNDLGQWVAVLDSGMTEGCFAR